ncbi:MAG TPA: hypothetical protein VN920_09460 [Pyrinomonadaceae bacterium]|nr:hypothetical protein [Pyrinomonadaceae bacterium]
MLKRYWTTIIILILCITSVAGPPASAQTNDQQITERESQEALELAQQFTTRFLETKDLTPIVKELYVTDFIERYKQARAVNPDFNKAPHLYFVPGLEYNSRLLTEANAEDWQRFYVAANNFILFGFVSVIKKSPKEIEDLKVTDLYPASVIKLLSRNPNLANMIEKKGGSRPIGSAEEMRNSTAVLEQANAAMREKLQGKPAAKIDNKGLIGKMNGDDFFKPHLQVMDEEFFGFPKGTRVVLITTPLLYQLMLVSTESKLKILWADPYTGD